MIDQLATDVAGQAIVGKLDTDANRETVARYNIRSIPTLLVFKNGQVVEEIPSSRPQYFKSKLLDHI
jgi:thioredoxin 1